MKIRLKILIVILFLFFCSLLTAYALIKTQKHKNLPLTAREFKVNICHPQTTTFSDSIQTYGTFLYKSKNDITSMQSGVVTAKYFEKGDSIKEGQILYELKNQELEIQYSQTLNNLNSARANVSLFKAKLKEKENTILCQLLSIENKELELKRYKEQLQSAEDKFLTNKELQNLGAISDQSIKDMEEEISTLKTNAEILERELSIARFGLTEQDLLNEGIVPASDKEQLKQQLLSLNSKTSQADLEVAEMELQNAENSVLLLEKLLENTKIYSPISGIIESTVYEKGEYVNQNNKVATIIDTSICTAISSIQETSLSSITKNTNALIDIPSLNKTLLTKISKIAPTADAVSGSFDIQADITNYDNQIKPGMFFNCTIHTDSEKEYLTIPESSLLNTKNNKAQCFAVKNGIAVLLNIKLEFIKKGLAYVNDGISKDAVIIVNPATELKEGSRVKIL